MTTIEARVSRLEAVYDHVATKADLNALEARVEARLGELEVHLLRWLVATMITAVGATAAVAAAITRLAG